MTNLRPDPARPATIAALALHDSDWNSQKDRKLFQSYLKDLAMGCYVTETSLQELLAEWNAIDAAKLKADAKKARLDFLKENKVTSFELWLPPAPEHLPESFRKRFKALGKGSFYREARGNSTTRFVHIENSKAGRQLADDLIARGEVRTVIPRGGTHRTNFYVEHGKVLPPAEGCSARIYNRRARHAPVDLTARQIERKAYANLRKERTK